MSQEELGNCFSFWVFPNLLFIEEINYGMENHSLCVWFSWHLLNSPNRLNTPSAFTISPLLWLCGRLYILIVGPLMGCEGKDLSYCGKLSAFLKEGFTLSGILVSFLSFSGSWCPINVVFLHWRLMFKAGNVIWHAICKHFISPLSLLLLF